MFQVVALETFNLPADQNGFLMAYIGILTMVGIVMSLVVIPSLWVTHDFKFSSVV